MAVDKLVDSTQLDADLTSVANAIRTKGGTSASLAFPAGFVSAVQAIPTGITPTGTKQISITQNGTTTENVTNYASAEITVSVPNTYSAGDEGKVVSNGALVSQTSDTVTANDTYDTTLINSLTVNVSGGGGGSPITLLDTITVTEQVRAFNIDITPYASYDMILILADITLTASDWLYVARNGSTTSGGSYSESASRLKGLLYVRGTTACGRSGWADALTNSTGMVSGNSTVTNLYAYTYTASKFITAGSKFYIYGGTYADILQ